MSIWEELDRLADWAKDNLRPETMPPPEITEKTRAAVQKKLTSDVLLKRYMHHLDSGSSPRNTEPWQALAEKRYAALTLSMIGSGLASGPGGIGWAPHALPDGDDPSIHGVGMAMLMASPVTVPYLWMAEVEDMVRALPLPRHVVGRNLLPHPWMFFSCEVAYGPVTFLAGGEHLNGAYIDWFLLRDNRTHLDVVVPLSFQHDAPSDKSTVILPMSIPYGKTWPDDFPEGEVQPIGVVLKRLAFINSPYVETVEHRLPRPIRREMHRAGLDVRPEDEETCRTVVLRRAAAEAQAQHDADRESGRDWRGHWWVSGHFRAQWYPSEEAHKVIWVAPYVKGDLSKPLIEKTYVVTR